MGTSGVRRGEVCVRVNVGGGGGRRLNVVALKLLPFATSSVVNVKYA